MFIKKRGTSVTINNLQTQAYEAIRKKIIYSELEPGKKISEKSLEEILNIGRTPIRESLIQLRQQELVYTIPQSGTYISKIDLNSAHNARFIREQLEKQIMLECCAKITDKTKKILSSILEEQEKAATNKDYYAFFQLDNLFHKATYEIADRADIWQFLRTNNTHLERFRWLAVKAKDIKFSSIMEEHYQLFDSILQKDLEQTVFLTVLHLRTMLKDQKIVVETFPDYFEMPIKTENK